MAGRCNESMGPIYATPGNTVILTVPVHGNRDLKRDTLRQLMRDAGLTEDDL